MGISKVILNGVTQMDVTQDTVASSNLLSGNTATGADGEKVNGGIEAKTSSDMTVNGATVTAPAGYYASAASKSVASGSAGTPTATKGTVTSHSVSVTPSVTNTTGYITGGTKTGTAVTVSASELVSGTKTISASGTTDVTNYESVSVPSGSAKTPATTITANPSISVNSSGLITATVSKTQSVTPSVSAGYVASGTAGTITVSGSGTNQLTTQAAQAIHPSTTDQTIASGKYLTGAQTVKAVTVTNLTAENIVEGVTVKIGDSTDDDCVTSVTGTASGGRYVVTISGTGDSGTCFVKHNGTYYYTNGDTFTYAIGDTLTCWVSYGDANKLYVDDTVVAGGVGQSVINYLYTLPAGGIGIEISQSRGESYIKITTNEPTISITSNGTYDVYEYSKAEVNVPSGGATNFVQGTFTTSSTGGVTQSISIPYSGNGYPISWTIEPTGGFYGNDDFRNLIQQYVTVIYCGMKSDTNTPPVWSENGVTNNQSGAEVMYRYKNSTSNSLITAYTGGQPTAYTGTETASGNNRQVIFKNATTMCIYVASTSYGFAPNIDYTYRIVYSE